MTTSTESETVTKHNLRCTDDAWHRFRMGALARRMTLTQYFDLLLDAAHESGAA